MMTRLLSWSRRRSFLLAIAICLALPLSLPGVASADHVFLPNYFPQPEVGEGESLPEPLLPLNALTGFEAPGKEFKDACGLVAGPGPEELYVSDYYHDVVDFFKKRERRPPKKGEQFGYVSSTPDADPEGGPCGLALVGSRLYVNDFRRGAWFYEGAISTEFDSGPATGIAVDPAGGRVYVTHSTYVAVYQLDGTPVLEGLEPLRIGEGALADAFGAAVSRFSATSGYLYVADAADKEVKVFDTAGSPIDPVAVIDGSLGPQQGFVDLKDAALAIDQSTGNLLVSDRLAKAEDPPMAVDEFAPDGGFRGQLPHAMADGEPAGIAVDPVSHNVYVTTGRREDSGVYAFGPAAPSHALLAQKAGSGEGTVKTTPTGISCPAACNAGEAAFAIGSLVTLEAAPAVHSTFSGWAVSGQPGACPGIGPCQVQMNADTEVTAEFTAIPQQTLTVATQGGGTVTSEPAGIECGAFCSEHFDQGSTVLLSAAPAAHSHLAGWTVEGQPAACPGTAACAVAMDQAAHVTATFVPNPDRALTLSIAGPGRVLSSPAGLDCQASCSHAFADGTAVTLESRPAEGYELLSWSGACSGKRRCLVQMDEDRSVAATFVRIEDALAVSVIGTGTGTVSDPAAGIDCGLTCAGIYKRGSVLTLTAQAEQGSRFLGFSGCDSVKGATCTVSVTEAKTVTAVFGEAPEIEVRRVSVHGPRATMAVGVPAPGLLQASGGGIAPAKVRARSEGVVNLRLSLSRKGKRMLRHSRKGKLLVHVALLFTSADGSKTTAQKIVTFKQGGKR
jgi:DNA-binding beta-propeller fold protein YncE